MANTLLYTAPEDFSKRNSTVAKDFERSKIENKELWMMRIPDNIQPKDLEGLTIKVPQASNTGDLGEVTILGTRYRVISSASSSANIEFKGLEELSVLIPEADPEDGNTLSLMQNPCTQFLSIIEDINIPSSIDNAEEIASRERPPRPQPKDMKMKFIPYGFYSIDEYREMGDSKKAPVLTIPDLDIPHPTSTAGAAVSSVSSPPAKRQKTGSTKPKVKKTAKSNENMEKNVKEKKVKKEKKPKKDKKAKAAKQVS